MKVLSWLWFALTCIIALAIGVVVTALVNLVMPGTNLTWTIIAVCLSSLVSAICAYLMGRRRQGTQSAAKP